MNPVAVIPSAILGLTLALPANLPALSRTAPPSPTQGRTPQASTQEPEEALSGLIKDFEKAHLLETVERDPKAAAAMYADLTKRRGGSPTFYGKCYLRLGICLDALGNQEQAKAAWRKAATLSPLIAVEANARLQGEKPRDLELRVRLQIHKLTEGKDLDAARHDLLWIGAESVPFLIQAIETQKLNLDFVVRATDILLALGGKETIAFIRETANSKDTLLRRALVRGFTSKVGPELAKAMAVYLDDPDERTREEAVRRIVNIVPTSTILDFLDEGPANLRDYLLGRFRNAPGTTAPQKTRSGSWYWNYAEDEDGKNSDRLLALYRRWFADGSPAFLDSKTANILRDWVLWDHLLRRPKAWDTLALIVRNATAPTLIPQYLQWTPLTTPAPSDLVALAEALPRYPRKPDKNQSTKDQLGPQWLMQQLRSMIMRHDQKPLLGHDFVEVIPTLAALDYDHTGVLSAAIESLAQPGDLGMVVGLIPKLYSTQHLVWISKQTPTPNLLPIYDKSLAYIWEQRKTKGNRFTADSLPRMLYLSLLHLEEPAIASFCIEEAGRHKELYGMVADRLLAWKTPPMESLKKLLVMRPEGELGARGRIFVHLARAGAKDMGESYGRADALGLTLTIPATGGRYRNANSCIAWLLAADRGAKPGPYLHPYGPEQLGKIVEQCLVAGGVVSWQSLGNVMSRGLPDHAGNYGYMPAYKVVIPDPVLAGIVRALPQASPTELAHQQVIQQVIQQLCVVPVSTHPSMKRCFEWMLGNANPEYRGQALGNMKAGDFPDLADKCIAALGDESARVQSTALSRLGELGTRQAFDKVLPFLESSEYFVRSAAIDALPKIDKKRGLAAVLPLIKDRSSNIRLKVISVCRTSLDPAVTPTLLLGLQDSRSDVRKAAQAALDAIRFYHEQKSFWDAWNKRARLGYTNPATALLEQAQKDQPLKVRIQAIRALGTLADPGSLPFLIQLMKDENAQIQKAAEESLDRIHAKKD